MTPPTHLSGAIPIVPFAEPRKAIDWLSSAFGAIPTLVVPPEPDLPLRHAEVRVGTGLVMVDDAERGGVFGLPGPVVVYVVVATAAEVDALHDRAAAAGAEIVQGLSDQEYGSRDFAARDPHGNVWSFGTYRPSLD
ncbi:MAG: VOC family protein [Actinomycetota bacterium]